MMTSEHKQVSMPPRFAAVIFFIVFNLLLLLFTKYTLLSIKDSNLIPLLPALLVSIILGILIGSIFGKILAQKGSGIRSFLIGMLIACFMLILLSFLLFAHYYFNDSSLILRFQHWQDYFIFYGTILLTLAITLGIWVIPLTGLASLYFNKRFWPGLVAVGKKQTNKNNTDVTHE
ncbi:hypothetical protein [Legionella cardiaca]|uniref:Uncharacterized protein n=1 Tax=Legionella cardiaca TaxID=1071983 RepID=A0ABY8APJ1_9GAMM|nr:hypothetical protein [Legionella cardiaca]WED42161.1 hypothetical protein PXX05_09490 [Legionella cardiaca]